MTLLVGPSAVGAPPVHAAGAGVFECRGVIDPWPGNGTHEPCSGTARGVFGSLVCVPFCDFSMSISFFSAACVANEPPLVTTLQGEISISIGATVFRAPYSATTIGPVLAIVTSGPTGLGVGALIPAQPPIPTCSAPGRLSYFIEGELQTT